MNAFHYTAELESIARDAQLFSGRMEDIFAELGKRLTACMNVERVNLWLFNDSEKRIECIGNFTRSTGEFSKGQQLQMRDIPKYYSHLKSNKTMAIDDVHESPITEEIAEIYCDPLGIKSLLDLPIRIQGELRGVLCYEHVETVRHWNDEEIQFALAANQIVALAMETTRRRTIQRKLEAVLREKDLLLKEMHHRIKNNLSVLISLLRMQGRESEDRYIQSVLSDCESRIFSMAKIHEQLYKAENYLTVDLHLYLQQLIDEFRTSSGNADSGILFETSLDKVILETRRAINLGLIVMEILNNITKHAFQPASKNKTVWVSVNNNQNRTVLQIKDNGKGFDPEKKNRNSLGMTLIEDLSEQIDAEMKLETGPEGTRYIFRFSNED